MAIGQCESPCNLTLTKKTLASCASNPGLLDSTNERIVSAVRLFTLMYTRAICFPGKGHGTFCISRKKTGSDFDRRRRFNFSQTKAIKKFGNISQKSRQQKQKTKTKWPPDFFNVPFYCLGRKTRVSLSLLLLLGPNESSRTIIGIILENQSKLLLHGFKHR